MAEEYRGYKVEMMPTFPMIEVKSKGAGFAPKPLQGKYTSRADAYKAIDSYLSNLKKGRANGKAKTTS